MLIEYQLRRLTEVQVEAMNASEYLIQTNNNNNNGF